MCGFEKPILNGDNALLEGALLKELEQAPDDAEILMNLALTEFKFPFCDEMKSVEYLNRIIKLSPTCFEALAMKMYCMDHHCCTVDETDLDQLLCISYHDPQKLAIAYYIKSWIYSPLHIKCDVDMEKKILLKSTEIFSYTHPLKRLGKIFEQEENPETAQVFFRKALSHVRNVLAKGDDCCITPQSFIDEYITGISLSDVNYNSLKSLTESLKR